MDPTPTYDEVVQLLTRAWSEALGVAATPASDFFEHGGTSLAALMIAETVADAYSAADGLNALALEAVFEQPDLQAMARRVHDFIATAGPAASPR